MFQYVAYPSWISPFVIPGLPIRWYSVMYLVAFAITFLLFIYQRNKNVIECTTDDAITLFLYTIAGVIIGGRLFSTLLYEGSAYYWKHPWLIFWPFEGGRFVGLPGMSYHGGLVGAIIGGLLFARKHKRNFFELADAVAAGVPLGYTFGRLGNFINGELWGRISTAPWAMVFPHAPQFSTHYEWVREIADQVGMEYTIGSFVNLPRHPSQLYEAFFEGIFLWLFLWFFIRHRKRYHGYVLGWYIIGYGVIRFFLEYFREPDANLGFIIKWGEQSDITALFVSPWNISMGQILCFLMTAAGVVLLMICKRKQKPIGASHHV